MFEVGQTAEFNFCISEKEMEWFREISQDESYIHVSKEIAIKIGFKDVIVYGGLMMARISRMVGEYLPGRMGVSVKWEIDYYKPLYVDEEATLKSEVVSFSKAANHLVCKFTIRTKDKLIAKGSTYSLVKNIS